MIHKELRGSKLVVLAGGHFANRDQLVEPRSRDFLARVDGGEKARTRRG